MIIARVDVSEKLGVDKFVVDEEHSHIDVDKQFVGEQQLNLLIKACPAALYDQESDGSIKFDYAGCLECGTCRVLCKDSIVKEWNYPQGTYGVEFRYG